MVGFFPFPRLFRRKDKTSPDYNSLLKKYFGKREILSLPGYMKFSIGLSSREMTDRKGRYSHVVYVLHKPQSEFACLE